MTSQLPGRPPEQGASEACVPPLISVICDGCGADKADVLAEIDADYEYLGVIEDAYALRRFRYVGCRECGLIYQNPRPSDQEIFHYYPDVYGCFAQCPPPGRMMGLLYKVMVWLKRRELMPLLPDDGVLLDFGCGNGHWLQAFKPHIKPTQRLVGVDPCQKPIDQLREFGVEAYVGDEHNIGEVVGEQSVDLILLNHVIEHVPDPRRLLRRLRSVLKPGGRILGVTPNVAAWDRKLFGKYWAGWHAPRHFILFDESSLRRYASDAGLELVDCRYEFEGANHWSVSAHSWLAQKLGWRASPGRYRMALYPLLLLPALPVTLVQKLFSKPSVMSFELRKPDADSQVEHGVPGRRPDNP